MDRGRLLRHAREAALGTCLGVMALVWAADARGPEPAASPATASSAARQHAADVVDYTLHARLDAASHRVYAEGAIVWRNASSAPVHELWLHLYLNAFKNQRSLFLRAPVGSGRGLLPVTDWGYIDVKKLALRELGGVDLWKNADVSSPGEPDDQTDIRVPLPRDVAPGATLTLDVAWEAKLPNIVLRTGYAGSFHMVAQWFPKIARLEPDGTWAHFPLYHLGEFYADFGTYDVTLDVPESHVVGATGSKVSEKSENGRTVVRYVQSDVHDFAWTSWDGFRELSDRTGGVAIRCLYPHGAGSLAAREVAAARFALAHFEKRYGPYPYSVLTIVHPPDDAREAGGMEYPTLITTGAWALSPVGMHDVEDVTVHELAHQYFYGLIASNESRFPFLDEGLATFAEQDALSARYGAGSALDLFGTKIDLSAIYRLGSLARSQDEPVAQAADAFASGASYAALAYERTSLLLSSLAGAYGEEPLWQTLADYAMRYRFEHPDARDFVAVVKSHLGPGAAENLRVGLFERGWVDYEVRDVQSKRKSAAAGIFDVAGKRETKSAVAESGWEGWALVVRRGTLKLPVTIELTAEDGSTTLVPWDAEGDWIRVPYRGQSRLVRASVDPQARILVDENLLNNTYAVRPEQSGRRVLERATFLAELMLQVVMP
jgi:hypothetical protein